MPKRSSRPPRPQDVNQRAARIVADATDDPPPTDGKPGPDGRPPTSRKNPAAVALGRLGGKKGGPARAAKLSKKRRSEIARAAAKKRWNREQGQR
jgi:hypothetical protein